MARAATVLAGLSALVLLGCGGNPAPPPPEPVSEDEASAINRAAKMLDEKRGTPPTPEQTQEESVR